MNNETLSCIAKRFSCRDFSERIPEDDCLRAIAQAAIQSPSGMNRQPWQIIIVKDKSLIDEMDAEGLAVMSHEGDRSLYDFIMSRGGRLLYNAPRMILIAIKRGESADMEMIDCGIAAQNVVIAATSLGLASLHCGLIKFSFSGEKGEQFRSRLKIREGYDCGIAVLLGYANKERSPHAPDESKITVVG